MHRTPVAVATLLASLAGGCSATARRNASCERALYAICEHKVECGISTDALVCVDELKLDVFCDPDATLDALKECSASAGEATCSEAVPDSCLQGALCDIGLGCDFMGCDDPEVPGDECLPETTDSGT